MGHKGILPREQNVHKEVVRCVVFAMRGLFGMVLTSYASSGSWYLLSAAVSSLGTYYGRRHQKMVLSCDILFLQKARE